jgi:hypothetical protein
MNLGWLRVEADERPAICTTLSRACRHVESKIATALMGLSLEILRSAVCLHRQGMTSREATVRLLRISMSLRRRACRLFRLRPG